MRVFVCVWFLVWIPLFNGVSIFVGNLMLNLSLKENSCGTFFNPLLG